MKKFLKALCVIFVLLSVLTSVMFGGVVTDAAADSILSVDFSSADDEALFKYCNIVGDLDNDGQTAATDLTLLSKTLLGMLTETKSHDVNKDGVVDIRDLIRLKKLVVKGVPSLVQDNAMVFDGTVSYTGEIVSLMTADTYYKVSFTYKTDSSFTVTLNGVAQNSVVKNYSLKSDMTEAGFIVYADALTVNSGSELIFEGKGTIDNISIAPTTDKWTDGNDQGGADIFPVE